MPENTPPSPPQKAPAVHYTADNRDPNTTSSPLNNGQKKISRRSSKPIINWLHRKLVGTGRTKGAQRRLPARSQVEYRTSGRTVSSPLPSDNAAHRRKDSKPLSLGSDHNARRISSPGTLGDTASFDQSFLEGQSGRWSRRSQREADEDASLRPLPPSSPPSPSPSHSSSSFASDLHTFRSGAASTKPTTLLSIDMHGGGMAHIAQAPLTPNSQFGRAHPHVRNSSNNTNSGIISSTASITFSSLPPLVTPDVTASRPSSFLLTPSSPTTPPATQNGASISSVQAPLHTSHHPRNNPRPSSPPMDNASMLTLASSAFGIPGRRGVVDPSLRSRPFSAIGDSLSQFGGGSLTYPDVESTSQFLLGDEERLDDRDVDASVRALRPRSSRRGSWESETSGWSAGIDDSPPSIIKQELSWSAAHSKGDELDEDTSTEDITYHDTEAGLPASPKSPRSLSECSTTPSKVVSTKTTTTLPITLHLVEAPTPRARRPTVAADSEEEEEGVEEEQEKASEIGITRPSTDSHTDTHNNDEFHSAPTTPLASKLHL